MGFRSTMAAMAIAGLMASPAFAQSGDYEAALRKMISQTAAGTCPADVMGAELLAGCLQQLPQMSAGLASLGAIESALFVRAEDRPEGRVEIYAVKFASGITLNWGSGVLRDGKFNIAFSGGD
jgi:hypothetical protein